MKDIFLPIYIVEGNDIMIIRSLRDLQLQVEPSTFMGNELIYDAKGRLLKVVIDRDLVDVFVTGEDPIHTTEFETLLRNYLIAMREPLAKDVDCDLSCLVDISLKYAVKTSLGDVLLNLWRILKKKMGAEEE